MQETGQHNKFYFNNPKVWEGLRRGSLQKEVQFLSNILGKEEERTVLDVGCGTGVHLNELSKQGFICTGIDINENMIKFAKSHYETPNFIVGDMKKLKEIVNESDFSLVFSICTTMTYFVDYPGLKSYLKTVFTILKPNGSFVFDVFNPIAFIEKIPFEGTFFMEDDEKFEKLGLRMRVKHTVVEEEQVVVEKKEITDLETGKKHIDETKFRMFFPLELKNLLLSVGFSDVRMYGDYSTTYKKLDKGKMVVVAKK